LSNSQKASPRPRWVEAEGVLYLGPGAVRKVRTAAATNVIKILRAFEAAEWPESIPTPCWGEGMDDQTVHQTLRSLHKGLKGMRFHVQRGSITWEVT
jgi:hypothetical protein